MNAYGEKDRLATLLNKGGIMFFTIQRQDCAYSGMVVISPLKDSCQRRAVYIRQLEYREEV